MLSSRTLAKLVLIAAMAVAAPAMVAAQAADSALAEQPPSIVQGGAELIRELAAEEAAFSSSIDSIAEQLAALGGDIANAEGIFDEMIEAIERQAALGGPNSNYVQNITNLIEQARAEDIGARDAGDTEMVARFQASAARFEVVRSNLGDLYADSFRALRDIRAQRGHFVRRIRAGMFDEAATIAEAGVEVMRRNNARINQIRDTIPTDTDTVVVE